MMKTVYDVKLAIGQMFVLFGLMDYFINTFHDFGSGFIITKNFDMAQFLTAKEARENSMEFQKHNEILKGILDLIAKESQNPEGKMEINYNIGFSGERLSQEVLDMLTNLGYDFYYNKFQYFYTISWSNAK